jgi:hypothetical protein
MSSNELHVSALRLGSIGARMSFGLAMLAAGALLTAPMLAAQSTQSNAAATETTAPKSAHSRSKPAAAHTPVPQEPPEAAQPAPELPHWPANDSPAKPTVTWDSQGLKIDASNASLHQILNDVASATGTKMEGFGADERVFGEYGPGQARDVLSQLLHGSGYNVLMIGDQGEGTPRQIVLSPRKAGGAPASANRPSQDSQDEDVPEQPEVEEQPPPQQPLINGRPPMPPQGPPGVPRTPQQVLQELQQRQQEMQQQQQQQQPQPH